MTKMSANYAGFWRRFLAVLIDGIVLSVVTFVIKLFVPGLNAFDSGSTGLVEVNTAYQAGMLGTAVTTLIAWGYYVYFIGSRGQTLGKMAMGIKVVKLDTGKNPDYVYAFLREIVGKFISGILLLLGYFWAIWDPKKQAWHDKIANTVVVRTN